MAFPLRKSSPLFKMASGFVYDNPVPPNLSVMWNFGSILGLCWSVQVLSGLLLACHYTPDINNAFNSLAYISREVHNGWFIQSIHANGASFFFIFLFLHIGRGIYFHSFFLKKVWWVGCHMLILVMGIAFTGYVLPWGQMSFWGATVIINLVSVVPYIGEALVQWVWGGYGVCNATLKRFFVLHFLLPFLLVVFMFSHLYFLHEVGSSNPLGVDTTHESICFHSLFTFKDLTGLIVVGSALMYICLCLPDLFSDPVNFSPADPMKTPSHIQPEWYFLFAYAVLRSIPNKTGGVLGLLCCVSVIYVLPFFPKGVFQGIQFSPISQIIFWCFISNFVFLSFIGASPVEYPFFEAGILSSVLYFSFFPLYILSYLLWESMLESATCSKYDSPYVIMEDEGYMEDSEEDF